MHFSESIFFGEFTYCVLNICVYVCMYVVEQRVYLSFKGVQTRTQHREHFMRAFWNVKDFNLDTRRELIDAIEEFTRSVRKADLRELKREGNKPAFTSYYSA